MSERRAQNIWVEQCEAARTIKARYGLAAALDYLVGEKLMTFAEAAATRAEFAQELPRFVSEIRRMFPPGEIRAHLGQIERALDYNNMEALEEDDPLCEDPDAAAKRVRQFIFIKELLTATALGTS
ncbi:MAG TPA: hypothetical protein VK148_16180 [Xanthobacteraceae bacterium]|jgi:hypothetical protein|nr:hypothetical protein [Xanthobacteraceae bacterium]